MNALQSFIAALETERKSAKQHLEPLHIAHNQAIARLNAIPPGSSNTRHYTEEQAARHAAERGRAALERIEWALSRAREHLQSTEEKA